MNKRDLAKQKWFLALNEAEFINLCRKWNDSNLNILIPESGNYDDYLDYFKTITPNQLRRLMKTGKDGMDIEAYAALSRWAEIVGSPSKIEKIRRTKMARDLEQNINEIAVGDDDVAFYEALIQQNVQQLNSTSVSQQEVARLTSNINIFRKELRTVKSRTIRKDTVLSRIIDQVDGVKQKPIKKKPAKKSVKKRVKKDVDGTKPVKKSVTRKKKTDGDKA